MVALRQWSSYVILNSMFLTCNWLYSSFYPMLQIYWNDAEIIFAMSVFSINFQLINPAETFGDIVIDYP